MDNLKWVSLPARDSKPMIKVIAILGFFLMLLVGFVELSWVGLFIAFFVSIIVFMQFVFPTTFTINENTLIVEFLFSKKEYDFARIKSYYPDNTGVLLSPFISPSRLENFRGIYVRYGRENKEKIVGMIKERVKV
ncbi:TPA: hypothetical protein DCW38_05645 [candidate division WOR-3 bacterium]|jgi:hypothetical protein|uniref:PH domain-containing protein n=1 Tax=candidate division WOR-3 bacterium TaxID=2052148 RepID=A0A350HAT0_UNCW3|nr:hypothetical protein [candidate division WOR-3 bacterium]